MAYKKPPDFITEQISPEQEERYDDLKKKILKMSEEIDKVKAQEARKKALAEVLEKVEQFRSMHQLFANDQSESNATRRYNGAKEDAFREFKDWLTKQLDTEGS